MEQDWVHCGTCASSTNKTAKNYKYPTRCGFVFSLNFATPGKVTVGAGFLLLFSHMCRISANSTVGIRIPDDQTLPAAGLYIVGAVRLLLHSHTESAQSLPLASEFQAVGQTLPAAWLYIVGAMRFLLH